MTVHMFTGVISVPKYSSPGLGEITQIDIISSALSKQMTSVLICRATHPSRTRWPGPHLALPIVLCFSL